MSTVQASEQTTINETKSIALVNNMLRLALYNVAFERGLFPKDSFKETMQYGMSQHKLKGDCAESRRILHMLEKGVMDAIKKKYAKTITFYITDAASGPGDEENVLEEYVFRVQYGTRDGAVALDGITASLGGQTKATSAGRVTGARRLDNEEYIKRAAKDMVKSLIALMRTLEPVPDKRKVSMKLTYVDDTPDDYQPPFFEASDPSVGYNWSRRPHGQTLGRVQTRHHNMSLHVQTILDEAYVFDFKNAMDVDKDRHNDRPGSNTRGEKTKIPEQPPHPGPAPKVDAAFTASELPVGTNTLADSLVNEDAETQGLLLTTQPQQHQPQCAMDDADYHYVVPDSQPSAVPDSQPSQPVPGEGDRLPTVCPAVCAQPPATGVCQQKDRTSSQQQHQHKQQSAPACSSGDPSRALDMVATPEFKPTISSRILEWMASRALRSWVDTIAIASKFPDVSFPVLDQALLDLSRSGALRSRGDGAYSFVSPSLGFDGSSQGWSTGGTRDSQESPTMFTASQGSQGTEEARRSQGKQRQPHHDAIAVRIESHLAAQCVISDGWQQHHQQRYLSPPMTVPINSSQGGYHGQPMSHSDRDDVSIGHSGSPSFGFPVQQQQSPFEHVGGSQSGSQDTLGGKFEFRTSRKPPLAPNPALRQRFGSVGGSESTGGSPFGRVGSGSHGRPQISTGAIALTPISRPSFGDNPAKQFTTSSQERTQKAAAAVAAAAVTEQSMRRKARFPAISPGIPNEVPWKKRLRSSQMMMT